MAWEKGPASSGVPAGDSVGSGVRASPEAPARSRFAVLVAQPAGRPGLLRRCLWFRFELTVTGFALAVGRRWVLEVLAGDGRAGPCDRRLMASPLVLREPAPAMAWVSAYEVRQLAQDALRWALHETRERLRNLSAELEPARQAEHRRLERYYLECRAEAGSPLRVLYHRAAAAMVFARLSGDPRRSGALAQRAARLLEEATRAREPALAARLARLERDRTRALAEVERRYRLRARLVPAGLAVVWQPKPPRDELPG